jgi:hypothetical protein
MAGDAPATCSAIADDVDLGGGDDVVISGIAECATAALAQSPSFSAQISQVYNAAAAAGATGAAVGAGIGFGLAEFGAEGALTALSSITGPILALINAAIAEAGGTALVGATAAGSSFGPIGLVIGVIIGAIVAIITLVVGGPSVTITNGKSFKCSDYAKTNLQNAANWFNTNPDLHQVTALWVANQFDLFLANPTWLYENQALTGLQQPPPPDANTGDPLDMIYRQLPGAFELLNKAQLAKASQLVAGTASLLPFYASIPDPFSQTLYPSTGVDENGNVVPGMGFVGVFGFGVFPDPVAAHWAVLPVQAMNGSSYEAYPPSWMPGSVDTNGDGDVHYGACPNLLTNDVIATGDPVQGGKVTGQTDMCKGIYLLQQLYPALTTDQCNRIFATNEGAYNTVITQAKAWAQAQTSPPTSAAILAQWNLVAADVATVQASWTDAAAVASATAADRVHLGGTGLPGSAGALALGTTANAAPSLPAPSAIGAAKGTAFGGSGFLGGSLGAAIAHAKGSPSIPLNASGPPPTITLGQALAAYQSGNRTALASLAASSPANAAVLSVAQRLAIQANFVARFLGSGPAGAILSGSHLASTTVL